MLLKASRVFRGSDAEHTEKGAAHRIGTAETSARGGLFHTDRRAFEQRPRALDASVFDEAARRQASFLPENAREVTRAHLTLNPEGIDAQIVAKMIEDPSLEVRDGAFGVRLRSVP